jgi:anaerobic selenocysteine-containing dehydrogenase
VWVELSPKDADAIGVQDRDVVRVESPRGSMTAPVYLNGTREGVVFVPFHFGWWDSDDDSSAANFLTRTEWDPVSKQPIYKVSAVRAVKVES